MSKSTASFWSEYEEILSKLLVPLSPDDGESEELVSLMEELLDLKLPRLLREYYLRTAQRKDINAVEHCLLPLGDIFVDQGHLVFYEENQRVCFWGIALSDLHLDDPPVARGDNEEPMQWGSEFPSLSQFLITMLFWHLPGVMDEIDPYQIHASAIDRVIENGTGWRLHTGGGQSGARALWRVGQLLLIMSSGDPLEAVAAGRTPDDLSAIESEFGPRIPKIRLGWMPRP